jgi:hypothetical protein
MSKALSTATAALMAIVILSACEDVGNGGGNGGPPLVVEENGVSSFSGTALTSSILALPVETLNATEQSSLAYMREEEKLAHDAYVYLDGLWGSSLRAFGNIANSESTHAEAVRQLLLRYNQADPAATLGAGEFANATLQGLYRQLTVAGIPTLIDALKVGAAIEELDMVDINRALADIDNQDIRLVYDNLLKGSRNHLRAFVKTLAQQGVVYTPQYLPQADFDAIVSTPIERN